MVQGFGYALAGIVALGIGLLHSATGSWHWPLLGLLVVLCGQIGELTKEFGQTTVAGQEMLDEPSWHWPKR